MTINLIGLQHRTSDGISTYGNRDFGMPIVIADPASGEPYTRIFSNAQGIRSIEIDSIVKWERLPNSVIATKYKAVAGAASDLQAGKQHKKDNPALMVRQSEQAQGKLLDNMGREIIRGPVGGGYYNNVHIISDSVGIEGSSVTVTNSVIEAPVCIRTGGMGASVSGNTLSCRLCIEFTGSLLMDNTLINNSCAGQLTNRPDGS